MEPANIELSLGAYGLKKLVVNGEDWTTNTKSVEVSVGASEVPVVAVTLLVEPTTIEGPGIVMLRGKNDNAKTAVQDFLSKISANFLDQAALNNMGYGSDATPGSIILAVLKETAERLP